MDVYEKRKLVLNKIRHGTSASCSTSALVKTHTNILSLVVNLAIVNCLGLEQAGRFSLGMFGNILPERCKREEWIHSKYGWHYHMA